MLWFLDRVGDESLMLNMTLLLLVTDFSISVCFCRQSSWMGGSPSAIADHNMDGSEDAQPSIDAEEDNIESPRVDEEDELSTDQIRASNKINSIATIEALCLKLSSL
jgi:hypothetical protein